MKVESKEEFISTLVEMGQELIDNETCMICKKTNKELSFHLKSLGVTVIKFPDPLVTRMEVRPDYVDRCYGEAILCMWCKSSLYQNFKRNDEDHNRVLEEYTEVRKLVRELYNFINK